MFHTHGLIIETPIIRIFLSIHAYLWLFLSKKIQRIVFIHGVGEGVLKTELQNLLNKYPVKYYDASYKKYGLGATEVYVYQNVKE